MYKKSGLACLLMAVFAGAAQAASVKDFVREPNVRDLALSPDGTHLAMVVPSDKSKEDYDKTELRVIDLTRNEITAVLNFPAQMSVLDATWVNHERLMVYAGKRVGGREGKFYDPNVIMVNRDGSKQETVFGPKAGSRTGRNLSQQDYADMAVLSVLPEDPENILIYKSYWGNTANSEHKPGITRLNVYNGKQSGFERIPYPEAGVRLDGNHVVRFATMTDENAGTRVYYRDDADDEFREVASYGLKGEGWLPLDIDSKTGTVYVTSDVGRKTKALMSWDPKTGKQEQLVADENSDITGFFFSSPVNGGDLLAVRASDPEAQWISLGRQAPELQLLTMAISAFKNRDVSVISRSWDGLTGIVAVSAENLPYEYYLVDAGKKTASLLTRAYPWLKSSDLASTRSLRLKARDGLELPALLTLPNGADKNLPIIVLVHGGPYGVQDERGFDTEVQLLAHNGYGVLQVNYRGSGGYGRAFEQAGYGQYGAAMQDDLVDATRWLISEGIADAKKICIMGHSYGGYAAVWGAMRDPELYRCVVASMGVYDLPLKYEEGECQKNDKCRRSVEQMMGTDESRLKAFSPVYHPEKLKAPLLLAHGDDDKRVPIEHAERLKKALTKAGKSFEWLEFAGEGHGFASEGNREKFYTRVLQFLDKHLKQG